MWNFIKSYFKLSIIAGLCTTAGLVIFDVAKNYKTVNIDYANIFGIIALVGLFFAGLWMIKKFFQLLSIHCQVLGFWGVIGAIVTGAFLSQFIPGSKK